MGMNTKETLAWEEVRGAQVIQSDVWKCLERGPGGAQREQQHTQGRVRFL